MLEDDTRRLQESEVTTAESAGLCISDDYGKLSRTPRRSPVLMAANKRGHFRGASGGQTADAEWRWWPHSAACAGPKSKRIKPEGRGSRAKTAGAASSCSWTQGLRSGSRGYLAVNSGTITDEMIREYIGARAHMQKFVERKRLAACSAKYRQ